MVRGLIERITLTPAVDGDGLEVDITGEIAAMLALCMAGDGCPNAKEPAQVAGVPSLFNRSAKVVAGTRFEPELFCRAFSCLSNFTDPNTF
ncbi:hypothetical protein [Lichenicoccus roseus]|uniref:Uncharacterized protein n=1 Tax=Lichenicoccus roseus TaxID=2683649 RepID=A0A5R9J5T1_9PROT|nr:hypothetical protein [Lichenicoccus roseus]TLU70716.1 hypothetical protein FE263_20310 [Lichenicoccus roseus]